VRPCNAQCSAMSAADSERKTRTPAVESVDGPIDSYQRVTEVATASRQALRASALRKAHLCPVVDKLRTTTELDPETSSL